MRKTIMTLAALTAKLALTAGPATAQAPEGYVPLPVGPNMEPCGSPGALEQAQREYPDARCYHGGYYVPADVYGTPAEQSAAAALTVTVACKATPETIRVKNNRNRTITIKAVGSIYRPFGYEPVRVERKLGAGKTVTFESGTGADRNKLTGSFIYNNDVGSKEGTRVRTSVGTFIDKC